MEHENFLDLSYAVRDFCKARKIALTIADIQAALRTMSGANDLEQVFDDFAAKTNDRYAKSIAESIERYAVSGGMEL